MKAEQQEAMERVRRGLAETCPPGSKHTYALIGREDLKVLLALLDEQRESLRPFALVAGELEDALDLIDDPDSRDDVGLIFGGMGLGSIDLSDFRRAALLSGAAP